MGKPGEGAAQRKQPAKGKKVGHFKWEGMRPIVQEGGEKRSEEKKKGGAS